MYTTMTMHIVPVTSNYFPLNSAFLLIPSFEHIGNNRQIYFSNQHNLLFVNKTLLIRHLHDKTLIIRFSANGHSSGNYYLNFRKFKIIILEEAYGHTTFQYGWCTCTHQLSNQNKVFIYNIIQCSVGCVFQYEYNLVACIKGL